MSLMEVNEASLLIQEAAHEDANIIFGAVVDPTLEGRVKVTVIATGFDLVGRSSNRLSEPSQTPVDLQHYTVASEGEARSASSGAGTCDGSARLSIARRPALDLAAAAPHRWRRWRTVRRRHGGADLDLEALSAFDVPAFLRREG